MVTTIRNTLYRSSPYENFSTEGLELDLQGWHSTDPVFQRLIGEVRPNLIIEVGTWKGASATQMAHLTKTIGLETEIVCVDTWLGAIEFLASDEDPTRSLKLKNGYPSIYYTFLANVVLSGHSDVITPFAQTSINGARWFSAQGTQADLIYIDASHEEADVLADLEAYWPSVRPGGVMFGDDFSAAWPSVIRAVRGFAQRRGLTLQDDNEFWILRKPVEVDQQRPAFVPDENAAPRPLLVVYGNKADAVFGRWLENLGYAFVSTETLASRNDWTYLDLQRAANASGVAIHVDNPQASNLLDELRPLFPESQSLFWVESANHTRTPSDIWCRQWHARLRVAGSTDRMVVFHPYKPLRQQRERCEQLFRRLGADLTNLRFGMEGFSSVLPPERPDPTSREFSDQFDLLNTLGVAPQEFFDMPNLTRIEARNEDVVVERADGGNFESYNPSHFLLHPPVPGSGWTRIILKTALPQNAKYFAATINLPNENAPDICYEMRVMSRDGLVLHSDETILKPMQAKCWVVKLPDDLPANCLLALGTQVATASSHAYSWSTWRDPILFS